MKTLFTILTFLLVTSTAFAQGGDYDELMQKSRRARTTSTIFVVAGPVIAAGGVGTLIYGLLANEIEDGNTAIYDNNGNFIGYDTKKKVLYMDRSKTANQSFNKNFEKQNRYEIPYTLTGNLKLRVFFDRSIAEVFINDGERVFTMQLFPEEKDNGIEFFSTNGFGGLAHCYVYEIKSIW